MNNGSKETETTKIRERKYVHGDCTYPSPSDADVGNIPGIIFSFRLIVDNKNSAGVALLI